MKVRYMGVQTMYGLDRTADVPEARTRAPLDLPDAGKMNDRIAEISKRTGLSREEVIGRAIGIVMGGPPPGCRGTNPSCPHYATCQARS